MESLGRIIERKTSFCNEFESFLEKFLRNLTAESQLLQKFLRQAIESSNKHSFNSKVWFYKISATMNRKGRNLRILESSWKVGFWKTSAKEESKLHRNEHRSFISRNPTKILKNINRIEEVEGGLMAGWGVVAPLFPPPRVIFFSKVLMPPTARRAVASYIIIAPTRVCARSVLTENARV